MFVRMASVYLTLAGSVALVPPACSGEVISPGSLHGTGAIPDAPRDPDAVPPGSPASGGATGSAGAGATGSGGHAGSAGATSSGGHAGATTPPPAPEPPPATSVSVRLVPESGGAGAGRVSFAVPLAPGDLVDSTYVRVLHQGAELALATRDLARHGDGSLRSVLVQLDLPLHSETDVVVELGRARGTPPLETVPVETTLLQSDGTLGPRVWAVLPAPWTSRSGIAGPQVPESIVADTSLSAWSRVCDYAGNDVAAFLEQIDDATVWLYDRATAHYRGYARRGDLVTLRTAFREAAIYRSRLTGSGAATRIGVPGKADDVKYHYTQNLALHYLMTGDDRFRESAEAVADRMNQLWSPEYRSGGSFWTERHAGFGLLAYVWAAIVSDDRSDEFWQLAEQAVRAYVDMHAAAPVGSGTPPARCFTHDDACSPWMSAILADALDAYATERPGALAERAKSAIVELGRMLARHGRDPSGKPYYQMHFAGQSEVDGYDEHWGESAYVIAMAWHHSARSEPELEAAARELIDGFAAHGRAPHLRSAGWQCRSAVATPYYMGF